MKKFALAGAIAMLLAMPTGSANAQLPSGNTGLGDARAQNQPTSRGIPGARWRAGNAGYGYGRSAYVAPYWRRHHRHHRHW
jgi:hypothetical protein